MIYTKKEQLTVIELKNYIKSVPIKMLKTILEKYPSNIIYCEINGKFVGIISMGDILRAWERKQDNVFVNMKFIALEYGKYKEAKKIFREKSNIHAIPIVSDEHTLLGEYIRWNDLFELEYLIDIIDVSNWEKGKRIVLVRPDEIFRSRNRIFKKVKEYLESQRMIVKCISYVEIAAYLKTDDVVLVVDENEACALRTVIKIKFDDNYEGKNRLRTYKDFFSKEFNFSDKQCAFYLKKLQERGIKIIGLTFRESVFYKQLMKKLEQRFIFFGKEPSNKLLEIMYQGFFGELYSKEYADSIVNMPIEYENSEGILRLRDCKSQYYNVVDGKRYTQNPLDTDTGDIYFFGPCYIYGHYVEDNNTIESLLSKRILQEGGRKEVVNCGSLGVDIKNRYLFRIMTTQFNKGDIIVIDRPPENITGVSYIDLNQVLEKENVNLEWFVDKVWHCNHKVNQLYANAIFDVLFPILYESESKEREPIEKDDNFIKNLYIDRYFYDFDALKYEKIGAIVMNCNPFTNGHRYLIEQALMVVDFLIIFVVEEDKSFFSYAERFAMVKMGVADLCNIMVVPSGPFILSQMSFPEYFIKETSQDIREHIEQDIKTFAKKIAPQLSIKYRFAGEEPEDEVTNQYNMVMKKILPEYGIKFVEISRKNIDGKCISASLVRKCIEEENIDRLSKFLPETTMKILGF